MAGEGTRKRTWGRKSQARKDGANTANLYMYAGTGKGEEEALTVCLIDRDPVFHPRLPPAIHPRTRIWGTEVEKV